MGFKWPWKDCGVKLNPDYVLPDNQQDPQVNQQEVQLPDTRLKAELKVYLVNGSTILFTDDVACRECPADFQRFVNWLTRPRGPGAVQDPFFTLHHATGFSVFRLSNITGANVRFFEDAV